MLCPAPPHYTHLTLQLRLASSAACVPMSMCSNTPPASLLTNNTRGYTHLALQLRLAPSKSCRGWKRPHCWQKRWCTPSRMMLLTCRDTAQHSTCLSSSAALPYASYEAHTYCTHTFTAACCKPQTLPVKLSPLHQGHELLAAAGLCPLYMCCKCMLAVNAPTSRHTNTEKQVLTLRWYSQIL